MYQFLNPNYVLTILHLNALMQSNNEHIYLPKFEI